MICRLPSFPPCRYSLPKRKRSLAVKNISEQPILLPSGSVSQRLQRIPSGANKFLSAKSFKLACTDFSKAAPNKDAAAEEYKNLVPGVSAKGISMVKRMGSVALMKIF